MADEKSGTNNIDDRPTKEIVVQIENKELSVRTLSDEQTLSIIEYYLLKGLHGTEIAEILGLSDKTIYRKIQTIRDRNSVSPNPSWFHTVLGEMVRNHGFLFAKTLKQAESIDMDPVDRAKVYYIAWQIQKELFMILPTIGYTGNTRLRVDAVRRDPYSMG